MIERIYLDMDGVISDFDRAVEERTGYPITELSPEQIRGVFAEDFFFAQSLPMEGSRRLISHLFATRLPVYILSSTSAWEDNRLHEKRSLEKQLFLNMHFGEFLFDKKIFVRHASYKPDYAESGSLLIDDHSYCTEPFEKAGGYAILHTDVSNTIHELNILLEETQVNER